MHGQPGKARDRWLATIGLLRQAIPMAAAATGAGTAGVAPKHSKPTRRRYRSAVHVPHGAMLRTQHLLLLDTFHQHAIRAAKLSRKLAAIACSTMAMLGRGQNPSSFRLHAGQLVMRPPRSSAQFCARACGTRQYKAQHAGVEGRSGRCSCAIHIVRHAQPSLFCAPVAPPVVWAPLASTSPHKPF